MLRPVLAFLTLCLAAFLLAPTIATVHERITALHIKREMPWQLWKWNDDNGPALPPLMGCSKKERQLWAEIQQWPARIQKDEAFNLRGIVATKEDHGEGVPHIPVVIYLNETKDEPGVLLGQVESGPGGYFTLLTSFPFELPADHYHIVAHAKQRQVDCFLYFGYWTDPETDVYSESEILWDPVTDAVAGREITLAGQLVDVVGAPIRNATVKVRIGDRTGSVDTDGEGRFALAHVPESPGELVAEASFRGDRHVKASQNETTIDVARERLHLEPEELAFTRSQPLAVSGHVYVAPSLREPEVRLTFDGTRVATCPACKPVQTLTVPVAEDGAFNVTLIVPSSEKPGATSVVVLGGGLVERYRYNVTIDIPTTLTLEASGTGLFRRGYVAEARLTDETGAPYPATLALRGPEGWTQNATDANGTLRVQGSASCGRHPAEAKFNGTDHALPADAQTTALVCGFLAFIPAWLLAVPWWVWPLAALAGYAAWWAWHNLRQRYAPVIRSGPPLRIAFTEPADDALGFAAVGESVTATAWLEEPLPDGHNLRMGAARRVEARPIERDLRAQARIVPERTGALSVRAEIVDARGRVVSRRTVVLHVVRYAEEIERRYLELRAQSGATDAVTPREFEQWLRERAPALDPAVARRLVHLFEEADYSPRVAGRADFAAYLAAERGVQEVGPHVTVA